MNYLDHLKNGYTCVILKQGEVVYSSKHIGIRPVLLLAYSKTDVSGCVAVDKIVGRAAALIYAYLGMSEVIAHVMSKGAKEVLDKHGIKNSAVTVCESIINRTGDGICPMEQAVMGISEPREALDAVRKKVEELKEGNINEDRKH